MRPEIYLAVVVYLLVSNSADACDKIKLEYEILATCEVRVLSIKNDKGVPVLEGQWAEANANWLHYLQGNATTVFDKNNEVPPTARKISRSGNSDTLYCEFGENNELISAYTVPTGWVETDNKWVTDGRKHIALVNGKLPSKELHKSEVTTCY